MAAMRIEVAALTSSPFAYVSLRDQKRPIYAMGYINSQDQDSSSWLPSHNSKADDSWLPTISHNSAVISESKDTRSDDSWLPSVSDNNGTNSNDQSGNDIDYSWLPSTFVENTKSKQKSDIVNKSTTKMKAKNTNTSTSLNKKSIKSSINSNSNSNDGNKSPQKKSKNEHWEVARKVVLPCDQENQKKSDSNSPSESKCVVTSPTSGGVSSLLQRWKDLADVKKSDDPKKSPSSESNKSESSYNESLNDNALYSPPTASNIEESDARSRRLSAPLPSRDSKDSNPGGAEKEKIRVVDIIKKLSREEELAASHAARQGNQLLPPIKITSHQKQIESEHKGIKNIKVSRHLIRGREAYNKFLMQMEHDKHQELKWLVDRNAVSKFSHRGRIKALLRFKLLRLGAQPRPDAEIRRCRVTKQLETNNCSDIMDIREKFNSKDEKGAMEPRKHRRYDPKNMTNEEAPATTTTNEVEIKTKTKTITSNEKQEPQQKPEPTSPNQTTPYYTTSCKDVVHKAKFVDSFSSPITSKDQHSKNDNKHDLVYEDEGQFMSAKASNSSQMEDKDTRMQALESFHDWMSTSEYSQLQSDLDDNESYDTQIFDPEYDWINDISRPKSDWEDMRQARYEEMLHSPSGNHQDIQKLLERKSVSSFLGSSLRDLIDQLMESRTQHPHVQVQKQDVVVKKKEESRKEVEQVDGLRVDDNQDCRSTSETKCSVYSEYADRRAYLEQSWRPKEVVCKSETITTTPPSTTTSPSIDHSLSSNRSHNNITPQSSPTVAHQTIELELIYYLRAHMEQLHHEILDLRNSVKSCVNMQVKLQHYFKQNVVAAETRSVQWKDQMKPPGIAKNSCSICYDMEVDSLLYRCGHMCTCFKCALELQRTGEECPVCDAPIVDVVKAMCS